MGGYAVQLMGETDNIAEIMTIGYEGRSIDEFLDTLETAGVERLIDVRELPLSRKPGFSKTALSEALAGRGIQYLHCRSLGNPKENRDLYRSGEVSEGARIYRRHLKNGSYEDFLDMARDLDKGRTCLLCFERDHSICHRDVIVEELESRSSALQVRHL
ncbi:MAG TPA: DUF488 domain-containing protein [Solirubrobacterales bacterium]|nr:DUF488 domain-containing protein [Solirubrobacterales bacterium]